MTREGVYTVVGTILFTTSVVVVGRSIVVGTRLVRTNVVVVLYNINTDAERSQEDTH